MLSEQDKKRLIDLTERARAPELIPRPPWNPDEPDSKEKYGRYLATREWGEIRRLVHYRAGGTCERCMSRPIAAVHHLTYVRKYNEDPADLQGICEPCHAFIHAKSQIDPAEVNDTSIPAGLAVVYSAGKRMDLSNCRLHLLEVTEDDRVFLMIRDDSKAAEWSGIGFLVEAESLIDLIGIIRK